MAHPEQGPTTLVPDGSTARHPRPPGGSSVPGMRATLTMPSAIGTWLPSVTPPIPHAHRRSCSSDQSSVDSRLPAASVEPFRRPATRSFRHHTPAAQLGHLTADLDFGRDRPQVGVPPVGGNTNSPSEDRENRPEEGHARHPPDDHQEAIDQQI